MAAREAFVTQQLSLFKAQCHALLTATKGDYYNLLDEHDAMRAQFMRDDETVDLGYFLSLTTRVKIHALAYKALKKMRNLQACDLSRLPRMVALHRTQLAKLGTIHYERNVTHYKHMCKRLLLLESYMAALVKA